MSPLLALILIADLSVGFATADRVYFRAGEADGLLLGAGVRVKRNGNDVGSCLIDFVSLHRASCPMDGGAAGDTAIFTAAKIASPPKPRVVELSDPVSEEEQREVRAALDTHEQALVVYAGDTKRRYWRALDATLEHTSYVAFGSGDFERERLDMIIDGVPLGFAGFRGYLRASAIVWANGASRLRLRPNEAAQLYVWQLEFSSREIGQRWALALGRISPLFAPGIAVVDGVQAGYRSRDGALEIGVIGGVVPDGLKMEPRFDSYAVSAYYGHEARAQMLRLFRHSGRVGMRGKNNIGFGLELEEAIDARVAPWIDASAQARVTLRDTDAFRVRLELMAARFAVRPVSGLEIAADVRYFGNMAADFDGFGASYWMASDRLHANLDARYRIASWLAVGAEGGAAHDFSSGIGRQYVGPVIAVPSLLDGHLGLSAAYREELGWARGRFVYAQGSLAFDPDLRALLRASFSEDALTQSLEPQREIGIYASADGRIASVVRWFVQASFRLPLNVYTLLPTRAATLFARAGVEATF